MQAERSFSPEEQALWQAAREWLRQRFAVVDEAPDKLTLQSGHERVHVDLALRLDAPWLVLRVPIAPEHELNLRHAVAQTSQLALAAITLWNGQLALRLAVPLSLPLHRLEQVMALCLKGVQLLREDAAEVSALAHALCRRMHK
jgi:hypothetical protein